MSGARIPLFPLEVVVFPRTSLPLHIFEERYKEMVGLAIGAGSEFGIVRSLENGLARQGCAVTVEKVYEMYPDGRMDILARGRRRFELVDVDSSKPCLEARVEWFDDDDVSPVPEAVKRQAVNHYMALRELNVLEMREDPNLLDPQMSFQLAQALPDLDLLGHLLSIRSETARLAELNQYLGAYIPRQRTIERMKTLAPTNGHGRKPEGM